MNLEEPKTYFIKFIEPCLKDWKQDIKSIGTEHKLRSVCFYLHGLSDIVANKKGINPNTYRQSLVKTYPEFKTIIDISNGTKHGNLTLGNAKFKNINQLKLSKAEYFDDTGFIDDMTDFDSGEYWSLQDDYGTAYSIYETIEAVINMWKKEIGV